MDAREPDSVVILDFPKKAEAPEIATSPIRPFRRDTAALPTSPPREPRAPLTPQDVRTQIFNTVRFVSYSRVNEVESIEELIADLERAINLENERFPDTVR